MRPVGDTPSFGELLRRLRLAAGQSQEALAERAGLSVRGISDLERGVRRVPYPDTVQTLARALGVPVSELATVVVPGRSTRMDAAAEASPPPPVHARLPTALTSFVGREHEMDEVRRLMRDSRLLTLTGPGGVGKTRLALEVARTQPPDEENGGVCLVEFGHVAEPALLPSVVAAHMGIGAQSGRPLLDTLIDALRIQRPLLVLDNCEHLVQACADLANLLLGSCPGLRILATSRERLGMVGETTWRMPSLGFRARPWI